MKTPYVNIGELRELNADGQGGCDWTTGRNNCKWSTEAKKKRFVLATIYGSKSVR